MCSEAGRTTAKNSLNFHDSAKGKRETFKFIFRYYGSGPSTYGFCWIPSTIVGGTSSHYNVRIVKYAVSLACILNDSMLNWYVDFICWGTAQKDGYI